MAKLFEGIKIKDMELKNRIVMPPMCMYSSDEHGHAKEFHYIHYGTRAIGGVGLIILEATGVEGRGRISGRDLGIWDDSHIEGLAKIVNICKEYGAKVGIQLGHAGRKCEVEGEEIIAPSPIAFSERYKVPIEMTKKDIEDVIHSFREGARRANEAGFDVIEIHAAHGYLINQFLSPLTNKRTDEYGGSLENRARFLKEIVEEVRKVWPEKKPIIVRVSAEDYVDEGNHPEDLAEILNLVKDKGVDIVNVSSGAVVATRIKVYPGYQIKFAEIIRQRTQLPVIAGGLISQPEMAEEILSNGRADLVYIGRELLRNPYWPLGAAKRLNHDIDWPVQYERAKL
ncbi:MAG: NADPH dehydrogenase NamA [Tissierellia bacterium]|nr:NADPH dehydrogenase NamA [Tissierellia bacterium]